MALTKKQVGGVVISGIFLEVLIAGIFYYYVVSYLIKLNSGLATTLAYVVLSIIEAGIAFVIVDRLFVK
jgi:hypothetical protein